jgi:hypothetical protein
MLYTSVRARGRISAASSGRIWHTLYAPYTQSCPTILRTASAAGSFFCEPHAPVAIFANRNAASDDHRHIPRRYGTTSRWQSCQAAPGCGGSYAPSGLYKEWPYRLEHTWCSCSRKTPRLVSNTRMVVAGPRHGGTAPVNRGTYTPPMPLRYCRTGQPSKRLPGASVNRAVPRGARRASLAAVPDALVGRIRPRRSEKHAGQGQGDERSGQGSARTACAGGVAGEAAFAAVCGTLALDRVRRRRLPERRSEARWPTRHPRCCIPTHDGLSSAP